MTLSLTRLVLAGCCLILLSGRASGEAAFDHAGLARDFLERFIRPQAARFAERSAALRDAIQSLCKRPQPARLAAARRAYREAAQSLAVIELVRFGPNREQSRLERLLLHPDPKGLVRRQVEAALSEADDRILSAGTLYGRSVALQGFPALELLLFGEGASGRAFKGGVAARRCGFATAIGENVASLSAAISREWSDPAGYSRLMLEPFAENPIYLKPEEVTLELAQSLINGIETVRNVRLAGPLGLRGPGKAPTAGILEVSGSTLPVIAGNIEGLIAHYREGGWQARLARADRRLARLVADELGSALRSLAKVNGVLSGARVSAQDRRNLIALGFPLKNAQGLAAELIASATGVTVGFNAGDGCRGAIALQQRERSCGQAGDDCRCLRRQARRLRVCRPRSRAGLRAADKASGPRP
jgi:hypothetical protein